MRAIFNTKFPNQLSNTRLGTITANIRCHTSEKELIKALKQESKDLAVRLPLSEVNKLGPVAEARQAYKALGNDPNRYRPSADALIRRAVKGADLYYINNVVDALNLVSIRTGFSIGGYNLLKIQGEIKLGVGKEGEPYEGIGRGAVNVKNLPLLRDDWGAFGSPTSDSTRTMIEDSTTKILLVIFDFGQNEAFPLALELLKSLLESYCEAQEMQMAIIQNK